MYSLCCINHRLPRKPPEDRICSESGQPLRYCTIAAAALSIPKELEKDSGAGVCSTTHSLSPPAPNRLRSHRVQPICCLVLQFESRARHLPQSQFGVSVNLSYKSVNTIGQRQRQTGRAGGHSRGPMHLPRALDSVDCEFRATHTYALKYLADAQEAHYGVYGNIAGEAAQRKELRAGKY